LQRQDRLAQGTRAALRPRGHAADVFRTRFIQTTLPDANQIGW
jgi:hypothetical protein